MNFKRLYGPIWIVAAVVLGVLIGRSTVQSTEWHPAPAVDAGLGRTVGPFQFNETPLRQVLSELSERSGARLLISWRAMEAAGIDEHAPVTRTTAAVPLENALAEVLEDVGGGAVRLTYRAESDGTIRISTKEELETYVVRVYDLRDLLENDRTYAQEQLSRLSGSSGPSSTWSDDVFIKELIDLLEMGIASVPPHWGSSAAYIGVFSGRLVIVQTEQDQEKIAALLRGLREPEKP